MTIDSNARPHPGFGSGAEVWFFRHGEVHADWQGRAYGGMDVPLSEQGLAETAERARDFSIIPFRAVISSPLERARRLGEALAEARSAPLVVAKELAEIQRGEWAGTPIAELYKTRPKEVGAFFADPWNAIVPGGENDRDVFERAWPVVESALRAHGGPIAFTTHYNVIRILVSYLIGVAPANSFRLRVDLSSACMLRDAALGWELCRSNVRAPWVSRADARAR